MGIYLVYLIIRQAKYMYKQTDKIASLIFAIRRQIEERVYRQKKMPLSLVQIIALRYLESRVKMTSMKNLADFLGITPPSATAIANGLTKLNLIERLADKKDRRIVCLKITKRGKYVLRKTFIKMLSQLKKEFKVLSKNEQQSLVKILEKISKKN